MKQSGLPRSAKSPVRECLCKSGGRGQASAVRSTVASDFFETAEEELSEASGLLYLSEHRLDDLFA